jgi:spore coat protein A, manganese oxidase
MSSLQRMVGAGLFASSGLMLSVTGCGPLATDGDGPLPRVSEPLAGEHEHPDPPGAPTYVDAGAGSPGAGGSASAAIPLSAADIPKFAQQLTIPGTLQGTPIRRASIAARPKDPLEPQLDYSIAVKQVRLQILPPPLPATTVLAYGGNVRDAGDSVPHVQYSVPGPRIEAVRGVAHDLTVHNEIVTPHFLPVDPTLHWANPNNIPVPTSPFIPFPPGYADAQFPVAHVTHTHGLMVESEMDGTAREWFTTLGQRGPHFVTQTYRQPNDQPSTHLWYHDHALGMTRLNVYAGLTGDYFIRDPASSLDFPPAGAQPVLPSGKYEIPLAIADRGFFTDGELNYPRTGINPDSPYWSVILPFNTNTVNGKVWPNLDVDRHQYRFRVRIAANDNIYGLAFDNGMSFTLIGSDGGYLPRPQSVQSVTLGSTERADVLVDFSGFAPGTKIVLQNTRAADADLGTIMQFTVKDTPSVAPPPLPETLNPMAPLVQDGPTRTKTQQFVVDARGNIVAMLDGLVHAEAPIDYSLVGSTERWNLVETTGITHLIHLHLIEYQVVERRPFDIAAYNLRWLLLNGQAPLTTRPIVVDPAPFFTGPAVPVAPYETGWKDTVQAQGGMVTSILARWAPQELAPAASRPGTNSFSIDPTTGAGYLWHCHILEHEDNDMMRDLVIINPWSAQKHYDPGTVVQDEGVNYRVSKAHAASSSTRPASRFDLFDRVNDNDGAWAAQIQYVTGDRVTFAGGLFRALADHQALPDATPPTQPALWEALPQTFCGQLTQLCAADPSDTGATCRDQAALGDEATCQAQFASCLATCAPSSIGAAHHEGAAAHVDYASSCGQLASYCHSDETALGVECHDLGHVGDEAACQARHDECLAQCAPSVPTATTFKPALSLGSHP